LMSLTVRRRCPVPFFWFPLFFFTAPASPGISTLSLHDALPILEHLVPTPAVRLSGIIAPARHWRTGLTSAAPFAELCPTALLLRSEEHTSELQSLTNLVCRLLLEKKKITRRELPTPTDLAATDT